MKNILVNIYQQVHLFNRQNLKVFMDKKEFQLMVKRGILYRLHQNIHQLNINICLYIQIQGVNDHSDLEWLILEAYDEQVDELLMCYLIFLCWYELIVIVFFAVHLENNVDIISCNQEFLSVVLGYSLLHASTGNNDLFVVCLVILSVGRCFDRKAFIVEHFHVNFGSLFVECKSDHLIISGV